MMGKRKIICTLLAVCLLSIATQAQDKDTLAAAEHLHHWNQVMAPSQRNPAFLQSAFASSITQAGLNASYKHANQAFIAQRGDGYTLFSAGVKSYLRLDESNTVWGAAAYQTGRKRNVRFNSTSDYDLLYPYVMADTLGGNMENERYTFNGGYALKLKKWTFGALIDFRAEHEYRTIDPRPRGIATDLTLRLGANYAWKDYKIGAGIGTRTYKQTNNVDFYNPLGVIPEYHMTGLGSDYVRFAGAVRSAYYKGTGIIADLQWAPDDGKTGAYVSLEGRFMPYENILTELNALPITRLETTTLNARVGWKHDKNIGWTAFLGLDGERRNGKEHIAGSSSSTEYRSLITLSMFSDNRYDYYLGGIINVGSKRNLTFSARFGFIDDLATYVDLRREMAYTKSYGTLSWQWMWHHAKSWFVEWSGNAAYYHNRSKRIVMPYAVMDSKITELVNSTYTALTAHQWTFGTAIHTYYYPKKWEGVGLYLNAGIQFDHSSTIRQTLLNASVGVSF
ncbi:DUF6850 family outer membrane beta-barrel protein [Prevotella aurantiaca]